MKKIGIVTFHNAWNNGAFLQAYATQMFLEKHGFDANIVETGIKFQPIVSTDAKADSWWREYEKRLTDCHHLLHVSLEKEYDAIIYGSDEIWNLSSYGANPIFWGYGLKADKKIAYAPCLGGLSGKYAIKHPITYLKTSWGLNRFFSAISVRDMATKRMVKTLTWHKITECLDPTFLADFTLYKGENTHGNYIVIYSYGLQAETIKRIIEFATFHKCRIIYTGSHCDWADENPILSPIEWLNLMYHAKYVFTSTFHGSVFSIICGREFYVVDTNSAKVKDLLYRLGIMDRMITDIDMQPQPINYMSLNNRIDRMRCQSEKYILSNI